MRQSFDEALVGISCRVYGALLSAYPREFRHRFTREMILAFRDRSRGVLAERGLLGWFGFLVHSATDFAVSLLRERASGARFALLTALAVACSVYSAWVDAHATEVQAPLLVIVLGAFLLSVIDPRRLVWWAFLVGAGIPGKFFVSALMAHRAPDWRFLFLFVFTLIAGSSGAFVRYVVTCCRRT